MDSSKRPTVMFVDDEKDVLAGLRQSLRKQRKIWNIAFACGAQEALEFMETTEVDVVTTDMRMPGLNGAELLAKVSNLYPSTLRFVLSGEASAAQTLRALPYTHQWMSKPCTREVLVDTIDRSLSLMARLGTEEVRRVVGRASGFSSPPEVYQGLQRALQDPAVEIATVVDWIEQDPVLAARVLQLTNSSFFGVRRVIVDLRDATTTIGLRLLADLVLVSGVFSAWSDLAPEVDVEIQRLLGHSRLVADAASNIANDAGLDPGPAVTAGLLHDIGHLALLSADSEKHSDPDSEPANRLQGQVLDASLDCTHADIGGAILQAWGLPLVIIEAVVRHIEPIPSQDGRLTTAGAVHLANALVLDRDPSAAYLESVGGQERWDHWKRVVSQSDEDADAA